MTRHLVTTLAAVLAASLVWLIVSQVVRAADALMPCDTTMCATPGDTPNR